MTRGEHILNLSLFPLFCLHVGFTGFGGWRPNCDRRPGNHAEWRAESPGQPRKVNGFSVAILPFPPLRLLVEVSRQTPLTGWALCEAGSWLLE